MADLINLTQTATDGDRVMAAWLNAVKNGIGGLETTIASLQSQINGLNTAIAKQYAVTSVSGLTVSVAQGSAKLQETGLIVVSPQKTLTVPDNSTSYVYLDSGGTVLVQVGRPEIGLELARIVASGGAIALIQNYPIRTVEPAAPDLTLYATRTYAEAQRWVEVATGKKTSNQAIPQRETYYTVTWQQVTGAGLDTGGLYLHSGSPREYVIHAQIRIDTTSVNSFPDLSGKMSIAVTGQGELGIALVQAESARGDLVLNASNAQPFTMDDGDVARLQAYITQGVNTRIREESRIQIWRLPLDP